MATSTQNSQGANKQDARQRHQSGLQGTQTPAQSGSGGAQGRHQLPPLPYPQNALEPHMSAETLEYHYGKHHKTYVEKLNNLIAGTHYANMELEEIIRTAQGPIFNNAAQTWNHTFFWNCLSPDAAGQPVGQLAQAINASFGSFDAFQEKFTSAAVELFGSGWTWLVRDRGGNVTIVATSNADTPIVGDNKPLLTCDVWEHAYYIDYRNARPDFLKAFWKLANWEFANRNFQG
jgi:Fe-Mn family superoxide dismutase